MQGSDRGSVKRQHMINDQTLGQTGEVRDLNRGLAHHPLGKPTRIS